MRLLLGGSPCTFWSIAQTKNRETDYSGLEIVFMKEDLQNVEG